MLSWLTSWMSGKKLGGVRKDGLSPEEELALARKQYKEGVIIGGVLRRVVEVDEATAQIKVQMGPEARWYKPTDVTIFRRQ